MVHVHLELVTCVLCFSAARTIVFACVGSKGGLRSHQRCMPLDLMAVHCSNAIGDFGLLRTESKRHRGDLIPLGTDYQSMSRL
jgi:hypothetical protein